MHSLLQHLHARLGDFWWYSLMIFMASRAADCLNAFVGLWLVPKYVESSELGAVMPLCHFASFLALPATVFASTFRNELTSLAVKNEFGKMKTLMRSVFIATAIFLFIAIVISHFVLPHFLERIRIAEGSLGLLIIVMSFVSAVAPVYSNALQSLKKFNAITIVNLLGAPVRLIAMLATMPLRALSGYFVGQTSTPAFSIVTSLIALRKELSIKSEPYWTNVTVKKFFFLFLIFSINGVVSSFSTLVEATILRQRLPEVESAAYYMTTRFSDIASFLSSTLILTIFPFTAELAAKGKDTRPMVVKVSAAIIGCNILLAGVFAFAGKPILTFLPNGAAYASFWWAIPWVILIISLGSAVSVFAAAECSANRFGYVKWMTPLYAVYALLMLCVTGYGYFSHIIPAGWTAFLAAHNIRSLEDICLWMTVFVVVRLACCALHMLFGRR